MELKRVVVTGLGALTPVGNTAEETWKNIQAGVSGAAPITHFDASKFKTQFACEVKNFKATDFIDRKEVRNEGANASTAARQKRRNLYFSYTSVNSHVFFMTFANREPQ